MPRVTLWSGTVIIILWLGCCNPQPPAPLTLTDQDAGTRVELRVGDSLLVALEDNPATGFAWDPQSIDTMILEQKESVYTPADSPPGVSGVGGTLTMRFQAVGAGETTLRLIYHRWFEPDTAPAQVFEVTVAVGEWQTGTGLK